jgi:predicted transcriptional regulator
MIVTYEILHGTTIFVQKSFCVIATGESHLALVQVTTGESSGCQQSFFIYKSPKVNCDWGVVTLSEEYRGLVEYVSRSARTKLIQILIDHFNSARAVAKKLEVSTKAVWNWINAGSTHPSNHHLQRVIRLAIGIDRESVLEILEKDLNNHQMCVRRLKKSRAKVG